MASFISKIVSVIGRATGNVNYETTEKRKKDLIKDMRSMERVFKTYIPPVGYKVEKYEVDGVPVELFKKKKGGSDKLVFVMHGGAYITGMAFIYRWMNRQYSKASGGGSVIHFDYRCAPEYKYPCALEDAIKVWDWALGKGYKEENIVTVGDSAGGHLNVSLLMKLREKGKKQPKASVCISPWLDMTLSGDSYTYNYPKDPVFGIKGKTPVRSEIDALAKSQLYCWYGDNDPENPYISPVYAEFDKDYPPMYITAGGNEMLLSDSQTLCEKLKKAGAEATLDVTPGMFHVFNIYRLFPESWKAIKAVNNFISEKLDVNR